MPRFEDVNLRELEDDLFNAVLWITMRIRALRGSDWSIIKQEALERCSEVSDKYLPDFGCIAADLNYETGFDDADACVTFGLMGGQGALGRDFPYGSTFAMSLVVNGEARAAYAADINSADVFGYGPTNLQVQHWRNFGYTDDHTSVGQVLAVDYSLPLYKQSVMLRNERENHSSILASMVCSLAHGGMFRRYEALEGVDTVWTMLSLIRGHTGALVLPRNSRWMPWYDAPMMGLAQACGMVYLQVDAYGEGLRELSLRPRLEPENRKEEIVILPAVHAQTFMEEYAARQAA